MKQLSEQIDSFAPELKLLLACLRAVVLEKDDESQIAAMCGSAINWDEFLGLANRHKVVSLTYAGLKKIGSHIIPAPVMATLRTRHQKNVKWMMLLTAETVRLVTLFETNDIAVLPLKGPVLSLMLYGNPAMRQSGDIDLLIEPEQLERAEDIVVKSGYKQLLDSDILCRHTNLRKDLLTHGRHLSYFSPALNIKLEVHFRFQRSSSILCPLTISEYGGRLDTILVAGRSIPALSPEDQFFFLCSHGGQHAWRRLTWLCDIARLACIHRDIDYDRLLEKGRRSGVRNYVVEGLFLTNRLLGVDYPDTLLSAAEINGTVRRLALLSVSLLANCTAGEVKSGSRQSILLNLHALFLIKGIRHKVGYILNSMKPQYNDVQQLPLPEPLFPLYYLLRPFLWLWRGLRNKMNSQL